MNNKFTLYNLLNDASNLWMSKEENNPKSIIGNLMKNIKNKGKLRDAQVEAIRIYLWLKEIGNNKKLSDIIKSNILFQNMEISDKYNGDYEYKENPTKRYLNRYFQDSNVKELNNLIHLNIENNEYERLLDNLFEEFEYPNYLFSLPMGAGKTYLIAAFIYIDLYMYLKGNNSQNYAKNAIILIPSAKKNSVLPSLITIKKFDPKWIFNEQDARYLKKILQFEVLDEIPNSDKLHNQNPNLLKINKRLMCKEYGNVFIINAEKIIPDNNQNNGKAMETKIKKANELKEAMSKIPKIGVYIDEAHHSYADEKSKKKIRTVLDMINKNNNICCCIGMSGTPYIPRIIEFKDKKIKLEDIQDIVYYYPLTKAINNFLKYPEIKEVEVNENTLINSSLDDFFNEYDIQYKNKSKSKIVFYCSNTNVLNKEILPQIIEWYDKNQRDKNEIFKYYTNRSKYPLPSNAFQDFLSLDSPLSKYRVILLVAVGSEGWDCKSLTSVVLPRKLDNIGSSKNFVLQTVCRCLREVDDAKNEKALIYLNKANFGILENELKNNYHLSISDIRKSSYKSYPVCKIKPEIGELIYYSIKEKYVSMLTEEKEDFSLFLKNYTFEQFKEENSYINQAKVTTIKNNGLNDGATYIDLKFNEFRFTFQEFLYTIEKSSFGLIKCSELMKYKDKLKDIYNEINKPNNKKWISNHPRNKTILHEIGKSISIGLTKKIKMKKVIEKEKVKINLLNWNMKKKPTINIKEDEQFQVYPKNSYNDLEEQTTDNAYENNKKILKAKFKYIDSTPNKEKSFNYIPYKMDSSYEFNFLNKMLGNMDKYNLELYYNGYKNEDLENFKISTPYGTYTPDFLLIKKENKKISKVLIIETKSKPFETPLKEQFVINTFLPENKNFSYKRIGDIENDVNEYNKMLEILDEFAKK